MSSSLDVEVLVLRSQLCFFVVFFLLKVIAVLFEVETAKNLILSNVSH